MAIEISIPRLGWNMDEGTFVGWLKKDGDCIRAGESLFSLESEKATEEIECLDDGILRIPQDGPQPGDKVAVGQIIGYLVKQDEAVPSAKRVAEPTPAAPALPQPATSRGREVWPSAISPRARRVARELGIDWNNIRGSGRNGRIRERDIRAAAVRSEPGALATGWSGPAANAPGSASIPIRRTIAERMLASVRSTAPVTLTTTCDATNLLNLRNQFKAAGGVVPSYTDLLIKLTAAALVEHPMLNGQWTEQRIIVPPAVHIGFAVDTQAGLFVPVIRDVAKLSLRQVAAQSQDLAERARQSKLKADEMRDDTFTITNLGAFGIDAFTPIINYPQCAILGVGRIKRQPVVVGDEMVAREQVTLSLTFDHRIVDGAPAARFLQALCRLIENPGPVLVA
jgi:pyruvate dehydrogenase E2 component (dihydrolipoamide acetyltransferase)